MLILEEKKKDAPQKMSEGAKRLLKALTTANKRREAEAAEKAAASEKK